MSDLNLTWGGQAVPCQIIDKVGGKRPAGAKKIGANFRKFSLVQEPLQGGRERLEPC